MGIRNKMLSFLGAAALALGAGCSSDVRNLGKPGFAPIASIGVGVDYTRPINKIRNIPESMRMAPRKDGTIAPMEGNSLTVDGIWDIDFGKLGLRTKLGNGYFLDIFDKVAYSTTSGSNNEDFSGPGYSTTSSITSRLFPGGALGCEDNSYESSSSGDNRRYNFYECNVNPSFSQIPTIELGIPLSMSRDEMHHVIIGLARKDYHLTLDTGYYDCGDKGRYHRYTLADISEMREYIGYRFSGLDSENRSVNLDVFLGCLQSQIDKNPKYPEIKMDKRGNSFFGGIGISYSF